MAGRRYDRSLVVAVRPDWTGPESLFGYEDAFRPAVTGWTRRPGIAPKTLEFMLEASEDRTIRIFCVLDEMNLAHVERYFSDFLSGFESGEPVLPNLDMIEGAWRRASGGAARIELPRTSL